MKAIATTIGITVTLCGVVFIMQAAGLANLKYFGPKFENARREVYEQTKSYNDGTIRELQNFMIEYRLADDAGKAALRSVVLHRAADFPQERLPLDVQSFIRELKGY